MAKRIGASRRASGIGWLVVATFAVAGMTQFNYAGPPPELDRLKADFMPPAPPKPSGPAAIPKSRAGDGLRWVLEAMNSGDVSEAPEKCDESFLEFISQKELGETLAEIREKAFEGQDAFAVRIMEGERDDNLSATITNKAGSRYLDAFVAVDDKTGKITSLRFNASSGPGNGGGAGAGGGANDGGAPSKGDWDAFGDNLQELGGDVTFAAYELVQKDKADLRSEWIMMPLASKDEDTAMAINAAGSLYVLGALVEDIAAGTITWNEQLPIHDDLKSLPSGRMQLEEVGATFPVSRYAQLMMTITDNTATDHLMARLGRQRIERYANQHSDLVNLNTPFLTTAEFFKLKLSADDLLREQFAKGDNDAQRTMLGITGEVAGLPLNMDALREWGDPTFIQHIGWFATARQCCKLMTELRRAELQPGMEPLGEALRGNPGLGLPVDTWPTVIFKGGQEPGVQSGVWMLERKDGRWFVMTVLWNNRKVGLSNEKFMQVVYKGIDILEREGVTAVQEAEPEDDGK
jgi:hypothetical protein